MARVCAKPRCPEIADGTYCTAHLREVRKRTTRSPESQRAQAWYKTKRWQSKRAQQLAAHPYCQCPHHQGKDKTAIATVADHVERHNGDVHRFWRGALMSLTAHCHNSWKQRIERSQDR